MIALPERAITIWRPWDQAILHGGKVIENRPWALWPHMIGVPIALHAGKRYDDDGAIHMQLGDLYHPPGPEGSPQGIVGVVIFDRVIDETNCDMDPLEDNPWFGGPFGWVVGAKRALKEPVPCRGMQGLWRIPPEVRAAMEAQW